MQWSPPHGHWEKCQSVHVGINITPSNNVCVCNTCACVKVWVWFSEHYCSRHIHCPTHVIARILNELRNVVYQKGCGLFQQNAFGRGGLNPWSILLFCPSRVRDKLVLHWLDKNGFHFGWFRIIQVTLSTTWWALHSCSEITAMTAEWAGALSWWISRFHLSGCFHCTYICTCYRAFA